MPLVRDVQLRQDERAQSLGHKIGLCLRVDGRIKETVQVLQHVVAIKKETLEETYPSRLASQHALAITYRADGQVKEAIEVLEHVVAIKKVTLVETHPSRLASQHALAGAYRADGQVKDGPADAYESNSEKRLLPKQSLRWWKNKK